MELKDSLEACLDFLKTISSISGARLVEGSLLGEPRAPGDPARACWGARLTKYFRNWDFSSSENFQCRIVYFSSHLTSAEY